jgi:Xaa-Pro dipeptidase
MNKHYDDLYPAHLEEIQRRWEAAMEAENLDGILVHSGSPLVAFQDDFVYTFKPNPNFLAWLPLTHHNDSALLVCPGARPQLFYFQPDDYWHVPPADPDSWWARHFDVQVVRQADDWQQGLREHLSRRSVGPGAIAAIGDAPSLNAGFSPDRVNPASLVIRLQVARTRKTAYEIACTQDASRLAAMAHREAERAFRAGENELVIHQRYLAACGQTDDEMPYHNIVALNDHGAVLHYQGRSTERPAQPLSFLIDAGCSVNGYASDITRTYAHQPGVFADLVSAMNDMQLGLIETIRARVDYRDLHLVAHRKIAQILKDFGIIKVAAEEAVDSGLSAVFFPHGLGHFLGLQVHDVNGLTDDSGQAIPRPEGHPFLRLTRVLESGNVLTVEPGLYFIEPLLRKWKAEGDPSMINWNQVEALMPYGGIRIEDNVVVGESGCDNLTRRAFSELPA